MLKDRVRELRPVYLSPDPASRASYVAAEIARAICGSRLSSCQWGSGRCAASARSPKPAGSSIQYSHGLHRFSIYGDLQFRWLAINPMYGLGV